MIELGTVWERRMNAPGYLPHLIRIDKKLTKILYAKDHGGNATHILTFVELAKYYTRDLVLPVEPIPSVEYLAKTRKLLALQSAAAYHGFVGTNPGIPGASGCAIREKVVAFLRRLKF